MSDFDYIKHLEGYNSNNKEEMIDFFANSELPNTWFLQQFSKPPHNKYPFYQKQYWELFAKIIIKRGVKSIKKEDILILNWFQEFNWPGLREIAVFVRENSLFFKDYFVRAVVEAFTLDDLLWLEMLLLSILVEKSFDTKEYNDIIKLSNENKGEKNSEVLNELKSMSEKIYDKYRYPDNYKHGDEV